MFYKFKSVEANRQVFISEIHEPNPLFNILCIVGIIEFKCINTGENITFFSYSILRLKLSFQKLKNEWFNRDNGRAFDTSKSQ